MRFSDLKASAAQCSGPETMEPENKQRLNVSRYAYQIMLADIDAFRVKESSGLLTASIPSRFINHIFHHFRDRAHASIAVMLANRRDQADELFKDIPRNDTYAVLLDRLLSQQEMLLLQEKEARRKHKGVSFSFRLNRENMNFLASDEAQQEARYYQDRVGEYIGTLLEEYSSLSNAERESVYYRETINEIQLALYSGNVLSLTLHSRKNVNGMPRPNTLYVKPVDIQQDSERLYNYLVGYTSMNKHGSWRIGSVRLTSIFNCKQLQQKSFISKEDRRILDSAIEEQGVQFLCTESSRQKIVIRFTENGLKKYRSILHLRPLCSAVRDRYTYEFDCPVYQAEVYFFKFGQDARVISPSSLAEKFTHDYQAALSTYSSTGDS